MFGVGFGFGFVVATVVGGNFGFGRIFIVFIVEFKLCVVVLCCDVFDCVLIGFFMNVFVGGVVFMNMDSNILSNL